MIGIMLTTFLELASKALLIEFKNTVDDIPSELRKPLREKLCQNISSTLETIAKKFHFLAWGSLVPLDKSLTILFSPYTPKICGLFKDRTNIDFRVGFDFDHKSMIQGVFNSTTGVGLEDFAQYIEFLISLAFPDGDTREAPSIPFSAMLIGYDPDGFLVTYPLTSYADLINELESIAIKLNQTPLSHNSPERDDSSNSPSF